MHHWAPRSHGIANAWRIHRLQFCGTHLPIHLAPRRIENRLHARVHACVKKRGKKQRKNGGSQMCGGQLGIGRATALQYAHHGLRALFVCDFASTNLHALEAELSAVNRDVEVHARIFDAADENAVRGVVDEAMSKYGRLDIFFANAGISMGMSKVEDIKVEEFTETLRINTIR